MSEAKHLLELAVAQFTGWREAKSGGAGIRGLIESMGLEEHEWQTLKKSGDAEMCLDFNDIEEIDSYFLDQKPSTRRRKIKAAVEYDR